MALTSGIDRLRRGLPRATTEGIERAALEVQAAAVRQVPVDTSSLQRTIRVEGEGESLRPERVVIAGDPSATRPTDGEPVVYAAPVEYGTPSRPATPYMTPAARQAKPAAEVAAELDALIRRSAL